MNGARAGGLAQFLRFGAVGVVNTTIGSGLVLLLAWQGVNAYAANIIGYAVGTLFSFFANARWTFGARTEAKSLARFFLVVAFAYGVNVVVLALFLRAGWSDLASQLPAMVTFTLCNFLGQRHYTFRREEPRA